MEMDLRQRLALRQYCACRELEPMFEVIALSSSPIDALSKGRASAPYLSRLMDRQAETLAALANQDLQSVFDAILARVVAIADLRDEAIAMRQLRAAKQQAHLVLSAADLSGQWHVLQVTAGMTRFADMAAKAALGFALRAAGLSDEGLFLVALGKMGAHELNYSSDIDIAAFYDPDIFQSGERSPADAASRIIRHMTKLLEQVTGDGYVLRTDLRLRPDPRSTPVAVSTRMAELYYESVGQNWERMVWIKARPFAGDLASADRFLNMLSRFVWRQHLDYWAINDIQAIKAMINATADRASLETVSADVKLGAGGIREIEFFAQTQQLILGGRDHSLRAGDTLGALEALVARGAVEARTADTLKHAYLLLRNIEHRIQMRHDEQTHKLPLDETARAQVAALSGAPDLARFDLAVRDVRLQVHDIYRSLFHQEGNVKSHAAYGNLVFTGVDDDPGTVETLAGFGFQNPAHIIETIRHWHRGHTPATRTARGRQLLTSLLPGLLSDMGSTGEPDQAFRHFEAFFSHLPSGVQTLSMLLAEAELRQDLIATLALAPRLGAMLGRKPNLLEALLQREQISPPALKAEDSFETAMDAARIFVRDQAFLIGHDLLQGRVAASQSALAFSDLADWAIRAMADAAEAECMRRFGPVPGDWCVAALGRLGGQEMTAASDLDIIVLYDPSTDGAQAWFTRFTQRLITALSASTAEGNLYEVDMRLRPSGRAGPVAVKLASFERYHLEEAWTWEHMALTRLRPIADRGDLGKALQKITRATLSSAKDPAKLRADIYDMRLRLAREKPGKGLWDLKYGAGGLLDVEFTVQHGLLLLGHSAGLTPVIKDAIKVLESAGHLTPAEGKTLQEGYVFLSSLQQIQRIAVTGNIKPERASAGLKSRLQRAVGEPGFEALEANLAAYKLAIDDIRTHHIGAL